MTDFRQQQRAFTGWIRHPDTAALPPGLELRRITLYRELLFNNITGFLESAFPVLQSRLPADHWECVLNGFFKDHRCHSPLFRNIPQEFLTYLQTRDWSQYSWAPELAHFEWALAAADMADGILPDAEAGDVWTSVPAMSPFVWPLVYQWPVHRFEAEEPDIPSDVPTALLLYRNDFHEVRKMLLSLPAAALLDALRKEPVPLTEAITRLASEQGLEPGWLTEHLRPWVQALEEEGVIRGVVPQCGVRG